MNKSIQLTILATIITGTFTLVPNTARANLSNASLIEFGLPTDDLVPATSIGGAVRGRVQFTLPDRATPNSRDISRGAGVKGDVQFTLAEEATGDLNFNAPPDQGQPEQGTFGGGVRGDLNFNAPPDQGQPEQGTFGAGVRGDLNFNAPPDQGQPEQGTFGAGVRGDLNFDSPPDQGQPEQGTFGSGVRGRGPMVVPAGTATPVVRSQVLPLTALVPQTKHGLTVSERPTIYAYLPPLGVTNVFFSLQDEEGNSHYDTILEVDADGGVLSISLPPETAALELEKNYLWYLAPIEPDGILRPDNYAVTAWVKRVELPINEQKFEKSLLKLATEYAKEGIWYETLNTLVEAQRAEPDNQTVAREWHDLLEQVGLEAIAFEPIYLY